MRRIIFICLYTILLASCEKVIEVDLAGVEKKYVIEGVITNQPGGCSVSITQTKDFEEDNSFTGISGAQVSITDNTGITTLLAETSSGVYTAGSLTGSPGQTYLLAVHINGRAFTASSTMPQPVNLDSVFVTDENQFSGTRKTINIQYHDPADISNNYRFTQHVNGKKMDQIFVRSDDRTDGNDVTVKLFSPRDDDDDENEIENGDVAQITMMCIDGAVYKYWYSLQQSATGDNQSATPANPVSNITGDALGYFSAHTIQEKSIIVP